MNEQIHAEFIDQDDATLRLALGACRLRVAPGTSEPWVSGTYRDPSGRQPLRQRTGGSELSLRQERSLVSALGMLRGAAEVELRLGWARPYHLVLDTGASEVELDLHGLPLRSLELRAGAGRVRLRLDRPHPVEAERVSLRIGAGALDAAGLGNLAARSLTVDSGAAAVDLDLTGELRRTLEARVTSGISGMQVTLPSDRPARVASETTLAGTDLGDGFLTRGGELFTAVEGEPVIRIEISTTLGGLRLRTRPSPA